jgi:protein-L-isoaspartate(D-aspartate) O-methyltransferase
MVSTIALNGIGMTSQRTRNRLVDRLREQGIVSIPVLDVMMNTPRHIFVDEAMAHKAYDDTSLPIGNGQTISQPYIVARMTELLLEASPQKVLEIGTGSGYQTAVLAQLVDDIYSIERIRPLLDKARQRIKMLGITNVTFRHSDGGEGWQKCGPFDGILSAAAPRQVPPELKEQLAIGGRLVMPVGDSRNQNLVVVDRLEDGFRECVVEPVKFVPLVVGRLE